MVGLLVVSLLWSARCPAHRRRRSGIASWTCESVLKRGERIDQFMRLKGAIPSPNSDLHEHSGFHQTLHREARGLD